MLLKRQDLKTEHYPAFLAFKQDKTYCDVVLQVQGKEIQGHKIILAMTIPYFRDLFQKSNKKIYVIKDIAAQTLNQLINLSYGYAFEVNFNNIEEIMSGAKILGLDKVMDSLEDFLIANLNLQNVLNSSRLGNLYKCERLIAAAQKLLDENFLNFAGTDKFLYLECSELISIIKSDYLKVPEETIYEAAMKWIKYTAPDRIPLLPEVLQNVRMCLLSRDFLFDVVRHEPLIQMSNESKFLLEEAFCYHMMSGSMDFPKTVQNRPRNSNRSTLIYIVGGDNNTSLEASKFIQIYNPERDEWIDEKTMIVDEDRYSLIFAASAVFDGKLYFFRGNDELADLMKTNDEDSTKVIIFDFKGKEILYGTNMKSPLCYASATALGESIYVCGGHTNMGSSNSASVYLPKLDSWTEIAPLNQKRAHHGSVSLNNRVYVIGGKNSSTLNSCESYNPKSNTWTFIQPMLVRRSSFGVAVLDGKIYACGGLISGFPPVFTNSMEVYDPATNEWNFVTSMTTRRKSFALIAYKKKLFAISGSCYHREETDFLDTVECYDPGQNSWSFVTEIPDATSGMGFGLISN